MEDEEKARSKLFTKSNLAKATGINENSIRNYIDYSKGTAKTLMDYGLIGRIKLEPEKEKSPWTYYKIKRNNNVEKTLRHQCQIDNEQAFDTLYYKIKTILSFLLLSNISINKAGYDYLKNYCMNYSDPIKLDDYDSYYNFIKDAINNFDVEKYAIKLDNATHSDLTYISNRWSALKKFDDFEETASQASQENFDEASENESDKIDRETGEKSNVISEMTMMIKGIEPSEIFDSDIDHPDYALKVCKLLVNENLTEDELFSKIYDYQDISTNEEEYYYHMELNNLLHNLEYNFYISCEKNKDNKDCYQLSETLKNKLKPFTDNSTSHDNFQLIDTLGKFEQASILKDKLSSQECQFEIYGLLSNGDLTEQELYNKLNTITKMSKSDLESLIAKSLKQLKNKGVIGSEKADNVEHYHLRQDFVQK